MDKKVTRKELLLSGLSIVAIFALSKVPSVLTKKLPLANNFKGNNNNSYGNHTYGGSKKNA